MPSSPIKIICRDVVVCCPRSSFARTGCTRRDVAAIRLMMVSAALLLCSSSSYGWSCSGVGDRFPPRRCGSRWETSAACRTCPWCRGFPGSRRAPPYPWRASRCRTVKSCGRCRAASIVPCRYWMSASDASNSAEAHFFPLASITSAVCTMALPAAHGRARANRGVAGQTQIAVSPCRCSIWRASMPSLFGQQPAEHGGVALPGRLHVAAEDQLVVAGKGHRAPSRSAARRRAPACRTCRCRGISCAWPTRVCAC